jgi:cobalt/nickel transport system permease protein
MHIPDGFLATPVWVALDVAAAAAVAVMAKRAQRGMDEGRTPLLGVMGAFVFAAQMINFPVGAGTSGHLVGSALLACTLGPAAAAVVMTAILAVQALVFQDGGLLALGANVVNMALVGVLAGYLPFHYWAGAGSRKAATFAGGVLSVVTAACMAIVELRISGVPMPGALLGVSLGLFLISALIEGAITMVVFGAFERMNPTWVTPAAVQPAKLKGALLVVAVVLASAGAVFASGLPDGLESLAEKTGIAEQARNLFETPLADYEVHGLESPWLRKAAAGLGGLAMIWIVCALLSRAIVRRRST